MKRITLVVLSILLSASALFAQQTVYVIDNETVEHFDGSQLQGKNILEYRIVTGGTGDKSVTIHFITTSHPSESAAAESRKTTTVLTMSKTDSLAMSQMNVLRASAGSGNMDSKTIFMPSAAEKKKVYVIDGELYEDESVFQSLSSQDIESLTVLLNGSATPEHYCDDCSAVIVKTKRKKK